MSTRILAAAVALMLASEPAIAAEMTHGDYMRVVIGDLIVHHPRVPEPPGPVRTAAVYLGIENAGDAPDRLIDVATPAASRASIHRTVIENDIAKMRPAENGVAIPAGGWAELEPGGHHIMLMMLAEPLKQGDTLELTLIFEAAGEITIDVPVVALGKVMHDGHGMGHGMDSGGNHSHGDDAD